MDGVTPLSFRSGSESQRGQKKKQPKGGLGRMKYNAQLSERGKTRTQEIAQMEELADKMAEAREAKLQREAAMEAFANRDRAVTFLPASQNAMIDGLVHETPREVEVPQAEPAQAPAPVQINEEQAMMATQPLDERQQKILAALLVR
eukprot:CAMPEP_0115862220 /NCGR_PEP_ID=MMETSP0287-20121206/18063_1 /TAXON_ID=412157 /ORGANISM="Chrysochromulina rotalis, Strain UIO044" /LENGTH=146 /DNA_ID=CAMNT_0003316633 /DNA_START=43 /DNA_END=483 /DNA_ORIENTATION=+